MPGKNYRHIIWDWNGTLLDDAWLCVDIMNHILRKRNLPELSRQHYAEIFDFPVRNYYVKLGFDAQLDPFEKLSVEFISQYLSRKFECNLRKNAREILAHFYECGVNQSVLSAAEHNHLLEAISHYGIWDFFTDVSGIDNHDADGKLENARLMMRELSLEPDAVLLIGDTLHDFHVAQAIGVDCVLISGGHQSRERIATSGMPLIQHLNELLK